MFLAKLNEVLTSKKSFISDRLNIAGLLISAFVNLITWVIVAGKIKPGNTGILLHYNVVYGSDLVARSWFAYLVPAIAMVLLVLNAILASFFYKKEKLASYFLSIFSIAVQLIFLTASLVLAVANSQ